MLFADELKELRERKQLLQRQLASALEIDTPNYIAVSKEEEENPNGNKSFYWHSYLAQTKRNFCNYGLQIKFMAF